jgi:signal transduction histidine kinase
MSSTLLQKRAVERAVLIRTAELTAANQSLSLEIEQRTRAEANLSLARDRAEAASQAKSAFLATMSHELRTPLNSVIGFSNVLASDGRLQMDHRPFVDEILTSGHRLLRLVNDILDLTQMLSAESKPGTDLLYLTDIVLAAKTSVEPFARSCCITIEMAVPDNFSAIYGDSKRVQRAVTHLLENAVKFNISGGSVQMRLTEDAGRQNLSIEDTGIGMPENQRARAGEYFSQNQPVLNRRYEGAGLGLSYAARVAELHGASITISDRVGGGTVVSVEFRKSIADKSARVA